VITGRRRPYVAHPEPEPLVTTPVDLSFPSGHAATSFAGAALLTAFAPRFAAPLFLIAAAIAWSRVYVGVHYPLDVVAGALLGLGVAAVLLQLKGARRRRDATGPRSLGAGRRRRRRALPPG
jgi:undecaprenyl-diphosphatase